MSEKTRKEKRSDAFIEVMEALEHQKREIEWILENASPSGQRFEDRHRQIIKGALFTALRDHADEAIFGFCFGSTDHALKSINNLITRMHRYEEVIF